MQPKIYHSLGPIIVSALSLFITFQVVQPIALFFGEEFSLLSNRGVGKIAFTSLVLFHIVLFCSLFLPSLIPRITALCLHFFKKSSWISSYLTYFFLFALLHVIVIVFFTLLSPYFAFTSTFTLSPFSLLAKLTLGFIATFLLAWSEETIFRCVIYMYWNQFYSKITSALITSLIFSLCHNLSAPLLLITSEWRLGLGLFLIGLFLNLLFIGTHKLYIGMGAHAGLKFVKVFCKIVPCVVVSPQAHMSLIFCDDLRKSLIVHGILAGSIVLTLIIYRKEIFTRVLQPDTESPTHFSQQQYESENFL